MPEMRETALIEGGDTGLRKLVNIFRERSRRNRIRLFLKHFRIERTTKVLDLGGWNGSHINALLSGTEVDRANVYVADIDERAVLSAQRKYGFTPVVVPESGTLPFPDGFFDIVFCSSVLEHVTIPKSMVWDLASGKEFTRQAVAHQTDFAAEIRRLGRKYYVQVPYRGFPIETHSWLPLLSYLPRPLQMAVMRLSNKFWIKKTSPDFHLPSMREYRTYFPDAAIEKEKVLFFTKSLIAIKSV